MQNSVIFILKAFPILISTTIIFRSGDLATDYKVLCAYSWLWHGNIFISTRRIDNQNRNIK